MRRGREPHDEREQKAEQQLEDVRTIADRQRQVHSHLTRGAASQKAASASPDGLAMLIEQNRMLARSRML
jgi:C4-dicarboxylate-specific signal transduction histidine kinase